MSATLTGIRCLRGDLRTHNSPIAIQIIGKDKDKGFPATIFLQYFLSFEKKANFCSVENLPDEKL
jgi:hypothetical protein